MTYLSDETYDLVTSSVPIICVDVLPVRKTAEGWKIGLITRATGSQAGKAALLGGRVWHNETLDDAIKRHMRESWGFSDFTFLPGNDIGHPFHVQQHLHQTSSQAPYSFDPSKHAIPLTYLIEIDQVPQPQAEASDFFWVGRDAIPESGYNQQFTMQAAFDFLASVAVLT